MEKANKNVAQSVDKIRCKGCNIRKAKKHFYDCRHVCKPCISKKNRVIREQKKESETEEQKLLRCKKRADSLRQRYRTDIYYREKKKRKNLVRYYKRKLENEKPAS